MPMRVSLASAGVWAQAEDWAQAHQSRSLASSKPMGWAGIGGIPEMLLISRRKEEG